MHSKLINNMAALKASYLLHLVMLLSLLSLMALSAHADQNAPMIQREEAVDVAIEALENATNWVRASMRLPREDNDNFYSSKMSNAVDGLIGTSNVNVAWDDCLRMYNDSMQSLTRLAGGRRHDDWDARTWVSAAMTSHGTCVEGLNEVEDVASSQAVAALHVRDALSQVLALFAMPENGESHNEQFGWSPFIANYQELLAPMDTSTNNLNIVVAQDGSGNYKTIRDAVAALRQWQRRGNERLIVYIKAGVYHEYVHIERNINNIMFVGDGIDKTIITGNHNVVDGSTTYSSATLIVAGDNFWARDLTIENTAGPEKHQAVAATIASDHSVFYRCSFKGYQDTLLVHSQRQFYRDCHIYGTIDFIFGNAAAVLQNCDIIVRRPMPHQANMITAQGRDDPNQNTGLSIHSSRVRPSSELESVKGSFKTYLGRPWKKYSRTVFLKSDLDGMVHPEGWSRWTGEFALSTLYYGEYMNTGDGASINRRVNWPGFHVIRDDKEAATFTVERFIQGTTWISESGVPFSSGL